MDQLPPLELLLLAIIAAAVALAWYLRRNVQHTTVFEFQRGLAFRNGVLQRELGPGRYRTFKDRDEIQVYDLRRSPLTLAGQEVLTKDNISLRISLAGTYQIENPRTLSLATTNLSHDMYSAAQQALRNVVAAMTLEEVLTKREDIDAALLAQVGEALKPMGVGLPSLAVRDVMLPANLKRAYAGVAEARKDGERQLEKARGEQAVLRNLANAARLMEEQPGLMQARMIQALSQGNNSIVYGAEPAAAPKPAKPKAK
jgi:regulator of protease activity HflC (stomatin/prohibitin superfamily)